MYLCTIGHSILTIAVVSSAVGAIIGSVISPVAVVLVVLVVVLIVVLVKYRNRIYLCNHTMDARPVNHPSVVAVKLSAVANTSAEVLTSSHNAVVHSEQSSTNHPVIVILPV